jgi:hypothetical protein
MVNLLYGLLLCLTTRTQTEESGMDSIDLIASPSQKLFIKGYDFLVIDLLHAAANPANEVMVIMVSYLIYQLPMTNVGHQHQTLLSQEVQGAVDSGLSQTRQVIMHLLIDLGWSKMATSLVQRFENHQSLGRQAVTVGAQVAKT